MNLYLAMVCMLWGERCYEHLDTHNPNNRFLLWILLTSYVVFWDSPIQGIDFVGMIVKDGCACPPLIVVAKQSKIEKAFLPGDLHRARKCQLHGS